MTIQAPWIDPYLAAIEEKDEGLYVGLLNEMLNYPQLHSGLTQHSRTPSAILQKIADNYELERIPIRIFENPNCPKDLIKRAISSSSLELRKYVAINESVTRNDIDQLIEIPELASSLAGRKNLDPDYFIYLWENYLIDKTEVPYLFNHYLLTALACNPSTPLKVLKNISKYEFLDFPENTVQSLLLSNPALPETVRAEYALQGIVPKSNILEKNDTTWSPTNQIFTLQDFPAKYLEILSQLGHPGGLLRSDFIPPRFEDLDSHAIFNLWQQDQSIYKTLWPELRDFKGWQDGGVEFKYWLNYDGNFTYFLCDLDLENEERQYDGEINYHSIPGSPDWIPFQRSITEAFENFGYIEFPEAIEWGGTSEWLQAWALSEADPELVRLTELGDRFVIEQDLDRFDEERVFDAEVIENLILPYSWKALSDKKKEFLIKFIKSVYLQQEDGFWQYAEHFLICIALNSSTSTELIKSYLKDLNSQLLVEALEIRGL
jgi:hypothetical protein